MTYKAVRNIKEARACIKAEVPRLTGRAREAIIELADGECHMKLWKLHETVGSGLFASVTLDAAHNELEKGFNAVPPDYREIAKVGSTPDFKDFNSTGLSGIEDIPIVPVNAEYTNTVQADKRTTFPIQKRGNLLALAWEDYVSDAIGAFRDQAGHLGRGAANTLNEFVIGALFDDNPTMYDGNPLFDDANHSNTTAGATLTHASLEGAIAGIMNQTGLKGEQIYQNVTKVACSPSNVLNVEELLNSSIMNANATATERTPAMNAIGRHLMATPLVSPHINAVATASVPKYTVVIGGSFGAGNYAMCGRAYNPRMLWMWPNARISVMGGEQAASVLSTVRSDGLEARGESWSDADKEVFEAKIRDQYESQGHPYYSSARLWDDGVIDPVDTRGVLAHALAIAGNKPRESEDLPGIFRM